MVTSSGRMMRTTPADAQVFARDESVMNASEHHSGNDGARVMRRPCCTLSKDSRTVHGLDR
jgi:hypothetical protein